MKCFESLKHILIKLHEWIQKKWLIVSIFLSTSSIWFSLILNFWGDKLKLITIDDEGKRQFTVIGFILTAVIIVFSCLIATAQRYYEYYKLNSDKDKRKLFVLEQVDVETSRICDNKFVTLKKIICGIKNGKITECPQIVSNPCEQLKHIIEKMNNCICKLLSQKEYSITENELYISLFYRFPLDDNTWTLADSSSPEKGLSVEELQQSGTTFSEVLKTKEPLLFYNSKEQARKNECYVRDGEDNVTENGELKGSVACYRININEGKNILIQAVLSISTYNKKFVNSVDRKIIDNVKFNMSEYIFKPFIKRINIELCLLYLLKLYEKKGNSD